MRTEIETLKLFKKKMIKITLFDNGDILWIEGKKFKQDMKSITDILRILDGVKSNIENPLFPKSDEEIKADEELLRILNKSISIRLRN